MDLMLDRLLPRVIDNSYRGPKAALWLLCILAVIKVAMGLNSIFNGSFVLSSADGVPLATYPPPAAQTIVAIFALWALGQLLFALLAVLALVRYRTMTPLLFAILLAEHLGRKLILQFLPIIRSDAVPASLINAALLALMAGGLLLSLWHRHAALPNQAPKVK
ncbi:MAG TPA: hypothetical protein VMS12_05680 [Thermoanaerobaculia bacterium]|nr:hypothetical protein [Thermoanaerobaculia bacterium]